MSRTFFRKFFPAVPRAAGRPAFRASALRGGEFGIIRAPGAPGAGNPGRTQDADNSSAVKRRGRGDAGRESGIGRALRPAPHAGPTRGPRRFGSVQVHRRNRPGGPALARLGLPGHSIQLPAFKYLYISRRIRPTFRPGVLPRSSCERRFPYRWSFLIRLRQASHEANTSRGCFRQPRARRKVPSCNRP